MSVKIEHERKFWSLVSKNCIEDLWDDLQEYFPFEQGKVDAEWKSHDVIYFDTKYSIYSEYDFARLKVNPDNVAVCLKKTVDTQENREELEFKVPLIAKDILFQSFSLLFGPPQSSSLQTYRRWKSEIAEIALYHNSKVEGMLIEVEANTPELVDSICEQLKIIFVRWDFKVCNKSMFQLLTKYS